jgi:hypothetical protein
MMSDASDKLARTRLAIIEHVYRKEARKDRFASAAKERAQADGDQWDAAATAAASGRGGTFRRLKRAAKSYWRHHPARMGLQLAKPVLSSYAHQHPATYVAVAAAAGAIFMIARPWRLISAGGVLLALAKSPQFAGVLMSAMSGGDWDDDI